MKKTFLAGFALLALAFASCTTPTHEENTVTTSDTVQVTDPVTGEVKTVTDHTQTTTTETKDNAAIPEAPAPGKGDTVKVLDPVTGETKTPVAH